MDSTPASASKWMPGVPKADFVKPAANVVLPPPAGPYSPKTVPMLNALSDAFDILRPGIASCRRCAAFDIFIGNDVVNVFS